MILQFHRGKYFRANGENDLECFSSFFPNNQIHGLMNSAQNIVVIRRRNKIRCKEYVLADFRRILQ